MCATKRAELLARPCTQPVQHPVQLELVTASSRPGQKTVPEYDLPKKSGRDRDRRRKDGKEDAHENPRTAQSARVRYTCIGSL